MNSQQHDTRSINDGSADLQNLAAATSASRVDQLNAAFYGRFPYPWPAQILRRFVDRDIERVMLCQALGDWQHRSIPRNPRIWVAGCGTNQAAIIALSFPDATVVGSDVSATSLDWCARMSRGLSLTNLELRQESLNNVGYENEFDYIVCTGVIHHNADPSSTLHKIARALKPEGVLELMVYNRYHRILSSAVQRAISALAGEGSEPGGNDQFKIAEALLKDTLPSGTLMADFLRQARGMPREQMTDLIMQPVEHSYTVESLAGLADVNGLDIVLPRVAEVARSNDLVSWNMRFAAGQLNQKYFELADLKRWQITNQLLCEHSPMLWFYLRRKTSAFKVTEADVCASFLEARFVRARTERATFRLEGDRYHELPASLAASATPPPHLRELVAAADGATPMGEMLKRHGFGLDFPTVNELRIKLTTPCFPFLHAV